MKPAVTHTYVGNDCDCPDDAAVTLLDSQGQVVEQFSVPFTAEGRNEVISRVVRSSASGYMITCSGCGRLYLETG